jgi:hypothetical protein
MSMRELNEKLSIVSRVVVHPKYRTVGLGSKLIHETLPLAGTPFVEMVAVMARYNPFADRAGMRRVAVQKPDGKVLLVAGLLERLGFNLQLLGSTRYVRGKLEGLDPTQISELKEAFVRNGHPRFRKEIAATRHMLYGTAAVYAEGVRNASTERLAKLVKIVGMLLQTKVYLFWR